MDRRLLIPTLFLVILIAASISGCFGTQEKIGGDKISVKYDQTMTNELVIASNTFAFDLNKVISSDQNTFFSPYSITIALGMAYEGARGTTASEMGLVLNFSSNDTIRHDLFHSIQSKINSPSDKYELNTANAFWAQNGYPIEQDYTDTLEQIYLAYGQSLNLKGDPSGSANTINGWVEDRTHDRIKDLVSPSDLMDAVLVLTNAIYFKGTWQHTFDKEATQQEKFLSSSGSEIEANMMKMCDKEKLLYYSERSGLKMLELPYDGNDLSMFIVLPSDRSADQSLLNIDEAAFRDLHDGMREFWVDLWLPKFEFEGKYWMSQTLSGMGMPTAFTPSADFTGIDPDGSIYIGDVIHQSFIKVDEEGTEAAAATAVVMKDSSSVFGDDEPEPEIFHADHSFLFLIQHKGTGQILFMGKVGDPTA